MSWTNELYRVYETCSGNPEFADPLLPVSHSTANAQIEVTIDENGNFVAARRVEKAEAVTIIPVSEDSGSRSSGICPHPFADKLQYLAGDYRDFVAGEKADNFRYFEAYLLGLHHWQTSENTHPAVDALYKYLSKSCIIADLISCKVLTLSEDGKALSDTEKIAGIVQKECFVRFRIAYRDYTKTAKTWEDSSLQECFVRYNSGNLDQKQLCYATGEYAVCTYKHPSKIRNAGDKAKLISANDESGFQYRGRFSNKQQALSVSYDFSQKMHSALKWLIARQGVNIGTSLVFLVWESRLRPLPDCRSSFSDAFLELDESGEPAEYPDTVQAYRSQLKKSIFGYQSQLDKDSRAMLLLLDSATPGRISIAQYTELASSGLLENIEKWHADTAWMQYLPKKKQSAYNSFSLYTIANCAFGTQKGNFLDCKPALLRETVLRLIPCVTEGRRIPRDIVRNLVNRASNPMAYDNFNNFRTVLETACGMLRKSIIEQKGACEMSLDVNNHDRSYLFGRLLAIADMAEMSTYENGTKRTTNAKRYWNVFSARPYQTWKILEERLQPYLQKLEGKAVRYTVLLNEIMETMPFEEFTSREKLQPSYLLGYHCQMNNFYTKHNQKEEQE